MEVVHDLTGATKLLLVDPSGELWVIHHQPDLQEGDFVLIGPDYMSGRRFVVLSNLQAFRVIDQWFARVRRSPPTVYVAGFTFSASRSSALLR